jgi:hypothetical protein
MNDGARAPDFVTLAVYAEYASEAERAGFLDLLRSAQLFADKMQVCPFRDKLRETKLWLELRVKDADRCPIALFVGHRGLSLMSEDSSLATLLDLLPGLREAKLVHMVRPAHWDAYAESANAPEDADMFVRTYRWSESSSGILHAVPMLAMKLGSYDMRHVDQLRSHLGTQRPDLKRSSQVFPAVSRRRDDETQTDLRVERIQGSPKATPRVMRREEREEDERSTIEPPPPDLPKH